jgi:nitroreductase
MSSGKHIETVSNVSLGTIESINHRASVRAFSPQRIDESTINCLLAAAIRAPTAMHLEPWAFSIIQDTALLKRLSDLAKPIFVAEIQRLHPGKGSHLLNDFSRPDFNFFYNANTLIIIWGKSTAAFAAADCWLAAENLMLSACSMGLGSCVIGSAVSALNNPEMKAEFGIPNDMQAIAPIVVGVADAPVTPSSRKAPHILSWIRGIDGGGSN